jgi:hypothetical protein
MTSDDDDDIIAAAKKAGMSGNIKIVDRHRGTETSVATFKRAHSFVCYKKVPQEAGCHSCTAYTYMSKSNHKETSCITQPTCSAGEGYVKGSTTAAGKCAACTDGTYMDIKAGHRVECKDWVSCGKDEFLTDESTSAAGTCKICPKGQTNDEEEHQLTSCKAIPKCKAGELLHPGDDELERLGNGVCLNSASLRPTNRELMIRGCETDECGNENDRLAACKQICLNLPKCIGINPNSRSGDNQHNDECAILGATRADDAYLIAETKKQLGGWDSTRHWTSRYGNANVIHIAKASGSHSFECFKKFREGGNCRTCPTLTFQTSGEHHNEECTQQPECKAGQYLKGGSSVTSKGSCTQCPAGSFTTKANQQFECKAGTVVCSQGEYLAGTSPTSEGDCVACAEGTYMSENRHSNTKCSAQTTCSAGEKWTGSSTEKAECSPCTAGIDYQPKNGHTEINCIAQDTCTIDEKLTGATASAKGRCNACPDGQYQSLDGHLETSCLEQDSCNAGQKISPPLTGVTQTCSACPAGQFQASTSHRITECIVHSTCSGSDEEVGTKGTSTKNTICAALAGCTADEFELPDLTANGKTQCQQLSVCGKGYHVTVASTKKADLICGSCGPNTFMTKQNHRELECTPQVPCGVGEKSSASSATTAIKCSSCPANTYRALSSHLETACMPQPTCTQGEYLKEGDATAEQQCVNCPSGMYNDNRNHRDSDCTELPSCGRGNYALFVGTSTKPTQCRDCLGGMYMDETLHREPDCKPLATCSAGDKYVAANNEAGECEACRDVGGKATYMNLTDHREATCIQVTTCTKNLQFEAAANSPESDRECLDYAECIASEFESFPGSETEDKICTERKACTTGERMTDPGTATTDRTCGACGTNSFQDAEIHAEPVCTPQPLCGPGEYISIDSATNQRTCRYCPDGTYRKDAAHRELACIAGEENLATIIADAANMIDGDDDSTPSSLDDLLVENKDALDAIERAIDNNEITFKALEKEVENCTPGDEGATKTSCDLLAQRKENAKLEYDSSQTMKAQLKTDQGMLETALTEASASAATAAAAKKASRSTTTMVVVIALALIVVIAAAAIVVKRGQEVVVRSDLGILSFENPQYDSNPAQPNGNTNNTSGYMDVNPMYSDNGGSGGGGGGGGISSGYMDVSANNAIPDGGSDEEEV